MYRKYSISLYQVAVVFAILELFAANLAWIFSLSFTQLIVTFVMPFMWTLWACCAAMDEPHSLWKPILLWFIIDLCALPMTGWLDEVTSRSRGRDGAELVILIVFAPSIFSILLGAISSNFSDVISTICDGVLRELPSSLQSNYLKDWIVFSILTAISCASPIYLYRAAMLVARHSYSKK